MTKLKIPRYLWAAFYKSTGNIYLVRTTRMIVECELSMSKGYTWAGDYIIKRIEVKK
jgi:hypothetical protein